MFDRNEAEPMRTHPEQHEKLLRAAGSKEGSDRHIIGEREEEEVEDEGGYGDDDGEVGSRTDTPPTSRGARRRRRDRFRDLVIRVQAAIIIILTASTAYLSLSLYDSSGEKCSNISRYTNLDRTRVDRFEGYSRPEYISTNLTEADEAWDAVNLGQGLVLVEQDEAAAIGLPETVQFEGKGVYAIAAYHAIHCVAMVRHLVRRMFEGDDLVQWDQHHIYHCLNLLKEEIMCAGDDTLLRSPFNDPRDEPRAGWSQNRQCAKWEELRDWSIEHSAGMRREGDGTGTFKLGVYYPDTDGLLL